MSLHHYWERIKSKLWPQSSSEEIAFDESGSPIRFPFIRKIFLSLIIILIATLSFGLGKLSSLNQSEPIKIEYENLDNDQISSVGKGRTLDSDSQGSTLGNGAVSASSQGTKYYYSWCGNNISDKNRVSFATALMAEKAGYTLAVNCKPR